MNRSAFAKIKKNILSAFLAQSISTISSVFISLFLPRFLGVEDYAYWQLFLFYSGYVGLFHFGLMDGIYLKYGGCPISKMNKTLIGNQMKLMLLWQSVISLIGIIIVWIMVNNPIRRFAFILSFFFLLSANALWFLGYVFQAGNETNVYSKAIICWRLVFIVIVGVSIIAGKQNARIIIASYVIAEFLGLIYISYRGADFLKCKFKISKNLLSETLSNIKIGIPLSFANMASTLIVGVGKMIIDSRWDIKTFGFFSLSIAMVNFALQFLQQFSLVMFPALRQIEGKKQILFYSLARDFIGIIMCIFMALYIPVKSVLLLWIPHYSISFDYLVILLPICVFDGKMQILYSTYLKVLRKERELLYINLASCGISFILCFMCELFFHSIWGITYVILFTIILRSIVSGYILSRMFGLSIEKNVITEFAFTVVFILINLNYVSLKAFIIYFAFVLLFILLRRKWIVQQLKEFRLLVLS